MVKIDKRLKGVGDKGENFLLFVKKKGQTKIADTLVVVERAGDELQALHLTKGCWVSKHVDVLKQSKQERSKQKERQVKQRF